MMLVVIARYLHPLNDPFVGQMMLTEAIGEAFVRCFDDCGAGARSGVGCGGGVGDGAANDVGGCGWMKVLMFRRPATFVALVLQWSCATKF